MELTNQELTKQRLHSVQRIADVAILGMAKKAKHKKVKPNLIYQIAESPDLYKLDNAFDILFEETLKKYGDLTTNDN